MSAAGLRIGAALASLVVLAGCQSAPSADDLKSSATKVAGSHSGKIAGLTVYPETGSGLVLAMQDGKSVAFGLNDGAQQLVDETARPFGSMSADSFPYADVEKAANSQCSNGDKPSAVEALVTPTGAVVIEAECGDRSLASQTLNGVPVAALAETYDAASIDAVLKESKTVWGDAIVALVMSRQLGQGFLVQGPTLDRAGTPCPARYTRDLKAGKEGEAGLAFTNAGCDGGEKSAAIPVGGVSGDRVAKAIQAGMGMIGIQNSDQLSMAKLVSRNGKPVVDLLGDQTGQMVTVDLDGEKVR